MTTNGILLPRLAAPLRARRPAPRQRPPRQPRPRARSRASCAGARSPRSGPASRPPRRPGFAPDQAERVVVRGFNDDDVVAARARSRSSATGTCASSRRCRSAPASAARSRATALVPSAETPRAHRGGARPARRRSPRRDPSDESRNYRLAGRARRRRLHQPGHRALLRHLQPHAAHRRRPLPPLPAERRRARRPRGAPQRRRPRRRSPPSCCAPSRHKPTGHRLDLGRSTEERADVPDRRVTARWTSPASTTPPASSAAPCSVRRELATALGFDPLAVLTAAERDAVARLPFSRRRPRARARRRRDARPARAARPRRPAHHARASPTRLGGGLDPEGPQGRRLHRCATSGRSTTQPFATDETCAAGWWLVRRAPLPATLNRLYREQDAALAALGDAPAGRAARSAVEIAFDTLCWHRAHGERLLADAWDWSRSASTDQGFAALGEFGANGLARHRLLARRALRHARRLPAALSAAIAGLPLDAASGRSTAACTSSPSSGPATRSSAMTPSERAAIGAHRRPAARPSARARRRGLARSRHDWPVDGAVAHRPHDPPRRASTSRPPSTSCVRLALGALSRARRARRPPRARGRATWSAPPTPPSCSPTSAPTSSRSSRRARRPRAPARSVSGRRAAPRERAGSSSI